MNQPAFIKARDEYDPALNVFGTAVTVMVANDATTGHEITLQSGAEGCGPPPHRHDWDESFYVLEGNVEFTYGEAVRLCGPGAFVHLPAGTVHGFRYGKGGGRLLEVAGSGSGASSMFRAVDAEIRPGVDEAATAIAILRRHGISFGA